MEYVRLGITDIKVSRLCFGSLTMGPLQANLSLAEGADLIRAALDRGINFIDTADSYGTYPYIRRALKGRTSQVVISTKSYDFTYRGMEKTVTRALRALGRNRIEIFLLHEQESELTLAGHRPALEFLLRAREKGDLRAVGISTHTVAAVRAATAIPEIEVIHPIINRAGLGIRQGNLPGMLAAAAQARDKGKGIFAMKPLGGGHLRHDPLEALRFVWGLPFVDAVAVGMQTRLEVEVNAAVCEGRPIPQETWQELATRPRRLHVESWCQGCGRCVDSCQHGALHLRGGQVEVEVERCVFCGYCGRVCPDFCLKIL